MRRGALLVAAVTCLTLGVPSGGAGELELSAFRMPSGNVGCMYAKFAGQPAFLRCDILSGIKPLPPKPRACELDWGTAIGLNRTGRARLMCVGDTAYDPRARVLAYGTTWRRNGFTCTSRTTGLRCSNLSGRGFKLSRQRSTRF